MPRAPRTSSAGLNAAPELTHIAGIAVAGVAAYGRQVCEMCGQGWPWTVFQKKSDGNRDVRLDLTNPERFRLSLYMSGGMSRPANGDSLGKLHAYGVRIRRLSR